MTDLFATLIALAGFALIASSMGRHQPEVAGRKLTPAVSRCTRIGGYALLVLVFLLDWNIHGAAYGAIAWFGHLSIGAWSVVAWLCIRARRRKHSAFTRSSTTRNSTTTFKGEN